jgi:hypothetical protein
MQRWGVFSVIDHKDEIRLATELMLYDKIAVPTPIEGDPADWERWQKNNWKPQALMEIIRRPNLKHLFIEAEWDLERQKNWGVAFEGVKADIDRVSAEIKKATDDRTAAAAAAYAHHSKEERDRAVQAAAYNETRNEIIRHLKGNLPFHFGPVELYAAYQSRAEFEALHHTQDSVEQVNFLIRHRLAVPDLDPDILLERVAELTATQTFQERRRLFYDWQVDQLQRGRDPETVLLELNQIVYDYNAAAQANNQKCRWETVVTVMTIAGAAIGLWAGFDPTSLIDVTKLADAPRYAVLLKLGRSEADAPQRIAAPGAMFHQMDADTSFQFRTVRQSENLPRRF